MNVVRRNQLLYFAVAIILGVIGYGRAGSQYQALGKRPGRAFTTGTRYEEAGRGRECEQDRINPSPLVGRSAGCQTVEARPGRTPEGKYPAPSGATVSAVSR